MICGTLMDAKIISQEADMMDDLSQIGCFAGCKSGYAERH